MIYINNIGWSIQFVPPFDLSLMREDGSFSIGSCDRNARIISICDTLEGFLLKKVICHELVHAAMFSYNIYLNVYTEEVFADLIATYGEEIIKLTNYLFKRIRREDI